MFQYMQWIPTDQASRNIQLSILIKWIMLLIINVGCIHINMKYTSIHINMQNLLATQTMIIYLYFIIDLFNFTLFNCFSYNLNNILFIKISNN